MDFKVVETHCTDQALRRSVPTIEEGVEVRGRLVAAVAIAIVASAAGILFGTLVPIEGLAMLGAMMLAGTIPAAIALLTRRHVLGLHLVSFAAAAAVSIDLLVFDPPVPGDAGLALPMAVAVGIFTLLPMRAALAYAGILFGVSMWVVTVAGASTVEWGLLMGIIVAFAAAMSGFVEKWHRDSVSFQKGLLDSEQDLRLMLDLVPAAVVRVDRQDRILHTNQRFLSIWPRVAGQDLDLQRSLIEQVPARYQGLVRSATQRARGRKQYQVLGQAQLEDKQWWVDATFSAMGDGEVLVSVRTLVKEEVLARQYDVDLQRVRQRLVNVAAHELKTPLTPLRMQLDMLHRSQEPMSKRHAAMVEQALKNVERIEDQVERLVLAHELELGLVKAQPHDVPCEVLARNLEAQGLIALVGERPSSGSCRVDMSLLEKSLKILKRSGVIGGAWVTLSVQRDELVLRVPLGDLDAEQIASGSPFHESHDLSESSRYSLAVFVAQGYARLAGATTEIDANRDHLTILIPVGDPGPGGLSGRGAWEPGALTVSFVS